MPQFQKKQMDLTCNGVLTPPVVEYFTHPPLSVLELFNHHQTESYAKLMKSKENDIKSKEILKKLKESKP